MVSRCSSSIVAKPSSTGVKERVMRVFSTVNRVQGGKLWRISEWAMPEAMASLYVKGWPRFFGMASINSLGNIARNEVTISRNWELPSLLRRYAHNWWAQLEGLFDGQVSLSTCRRALKMVSYFSRVASIVIWKKIDHQNFGLILMSIISSF